MSVLGRGLCLVDALLSRKVLVPELLPYIGRGRSLGFNYIQTMRYIIIPQAFKNVLPALANEFIVLIKETSVAGYAGIIDLTKGGDIIRGRTFEAFMPLIAVAAIYLVLVVFFTWLVGKLERRLRSSER